MIAVLGSINMDLVLRVPRFPQPGETIAGHDASQYSGGKGANQAVAAARLGADVRLFGKVGDDDFGERLLGGLSENSVKVDAIEREALCTSGMASIWVNDGGENAIVLAAGANEHVDEDYVQRHLDAIASADILLLQLEIPIETVAALLRCLPKEGPIVVLDPAPAQDLSSLPLYRVDFLTPNEHELRCIAGTGPVEEGAFRLLDQGAKNVICTLGNQGAIWLSEDGTIAHFSSPRVNAIDSTGAGDAFNGALAWALQECSVDEAIGQGILGGALATTKRGAQDSLPHLREIEALAASNGKGHEY